MGSQGSPDCTAEEVLDPEPNLPPFSCLPHIRPQDSLLGLLVGAVLGNVLPGLDLVQALPALGCGPVLRPLEELASETKARLQLVESRRQPLAALCRS